MADFARGLGNGAARAHSQASPWLTRLARFGLAAKAIVHIVVGLLALRVAWNGAGRAEDTRGAIQELGRQPFGYILLPVIGIGLIGYAIWRFLQAIADTEHAGSSAGGIGKRIGFAFSGVIYLGLAAFALGLTAGSGGGERKWTARALSAPLGEWWVFLAGAGIIGYGVFQVYQAWKEEFLRPLKTGEMTASELEWAARAGKIGFAARGVVFAVIGIFLLQAALHSSAREARGLEGALNALLRQPGGPWLLGGVAIGLAAYGAFLLVEARFRVVRTR